MCIRNSRFNAKIKVSAYDKSQFQTESEVLFNPLLLVHTNLSFFKITLSQKKTDQQS